MAYNQSATTLYCADAMALLRRLPDDMADAIITDPPYAMGQNNTARSQPTSAKYTSRKRDNPLPNFDGDTMDQRTWTLFMTDILLEARRVCRTGAACAIFTDWRQLPALTDALQRAGWTWRGVAIWDKCNSRPQAGRFKQQAEFIVWGSNGSMPTTRKAPCMPGVFSYSNVAGGRRLHQTQKPIELMRQIVQICERGGMILDPFAGSGSTLAAASEAGYTSIGAERNQMIAQIAAKRLQISISA